MVDKNNIVYLAAGHKLYAVRPDKSIKWTFEAGNRISTPAIGADGRIYFGAGEGYLYAVGRPVSSRHATRHHPALAGKLSDQGYRLLCRNFEEYLRG